MTFATSTQSDMSGRIVKCTSTRKRAAESDNAGSARATADDLTAELDSLFVQPTPMVKRIVDVVGASLGLIRRCRFVGDRLDHQADIPRTDLLHAAARGKGRTPIPDV